MNSASPLSAPSTSGPSSGAPACATDMTAPGGAPVHDLDVLRTVDAWLDQGGRVALAMVTSTWGSAPRPVGSLMAVHADGRIAGSVSGGCVEGAVVEQALAAIAEDEPRTLTFGVTQETAWSVGLPCGGQVSLYLYPLDPTPSRTRRRLLRALLAAVDTHRSVVLATDLETGLQTLLFADAPPQGEVVPPPEVLSALPGIIARDRSQLVLCDLDMVDDEADAPRWFLRVVSPHRRLILIGAVHISQALAPMAALAGYEVIVVDPRSALATPERLPGVRLIGDWPDEALDALVPDPRTAVVALSHDPKLDDPALKRALASPAFYVGALGSVKSHQRRRQRLAEDGVPLADIDRIHGPVGLDIGAQTPVEIALAILAELVLVHRGPKGAARHPASA